MNTGGRDNAGNPLGMRKLDRDGPFVLPPLLCSERRKQYFQRANRVFATQAAITAYASEGQKALDAAFERGTLADDTRTKITLGHQVIVWPFRQLRYSFREAGADLANQSFLMLYGNFEAYIVDLVQDALSSDGNEDPYGSTLSLLAKSKWDARLNRINSQLVLGLGTSRYRQAYAAIQMEFLGSKVTDPIEFLQFLAEVRHRLVHSAGRVDMKLLSGHPNSGVDSGDSIKLPLDLPSQVFFFLVPLTGVIDDAFCTKYGWARSTVRIESLVDTLSTEDA